MANGKGTISCYYCKHFAGNENGRCNLYSKPIPMDAVGHLNPICCDFVEGVNSEAMFMMQSQLDEISPRMERGYLYAFPYPSHDRAVELKKIAKLSPHV